MATQIAARAISIAAGTSVFVSLNPRRTVDRRHFGVSGNENDEIGDEDAMRGRRWTRRAEIAVTIGLPLLALLLYFIGYVVRIIRGL